jgi:hypothetical protein
VLGWHGGDLMILRDLSHPQRDIPSLVITRGHADRL